MSKIQFIGGSAHPELAKKISSNLGIPLTPTRVEKFSDGETYVRIKEKVRGDDVFFLQTLCDPVNENLMELLVTIDALKRASAQRINVICPYLAYSRQDRKVISREPITAKLVANLISKAGADRVVTVDLHSDQIQGFFDIPFDHFVGYPQFANYLKGKSYKDMAIAAPDTGAMKRCRKMAGLLEVPLVVLDKRRTEHNRSEVVRVIGDVEGKLIVIVDDIIDTGGTIANAAKVLKNAGARDVIVCATHALLSGQAVERLEVSPVSKILLLDTVPINGEKKLEKMEIISLADLFSQITKRIHEGRSLGALFTWEKKVTKL